MRMAAQWSEHEARVVLHAWQVSGLSIERFASQRGLVPQRLRWWKKKLEDAAMPARAKGSTLLPVRVVEPSRGTPIQIILPNGLSIRVGRGFDEETFARVMAILGGR
jgi:hypothetical protein